MTPVPEEATAAAKAAKASKESKTTKETKDSKEPKDSKKTKEDSADAKGTALLRRMAEDLAEVTGSLARLRADVDALKQPPAPQPRDPSGAAASKAGRGRLAPASRTEQVINALAAEPDIAVTVAIRGGANNGDSSFIQFWDATEINAADSTRLAKIAYAFSSAPKVALLRLLLDQGEQSAAQLGEKAGLTTGSLYHHLRELVHAEVVHQSGKNRYALTDLGRRAVFALLALAVS